MDFDFKPDIYYSKEYIELYTDKLSSHFEFKYTNGKNIFYTSSVKRKIIGYKKIEEYYDLETQYGFAGLYCNNENMKFLSEALENYKIYCVKNKIIAEFIRFNPYNTFPLKFSNQLDFISKNRKTVTVPLNTENYNEIYENYSSSLKRNLKKSWKEDLKYQILEKNDETINIFKNLYDKTMDRNNAENFYYFSFEYFKNLFLQNHTLVRGVNYRGKVINIILLLESEYHIYYHLGATDPNYYKLNTNPFIFDSIIKEFLTKKQGFFLGGGFSSNENDTLLRFKKKFSSLLHDYYLGGLIFDKEKYIYLNSNWNKQHGQDNNYFLKYRTKNEN